MYHSWTSQEFRAIPVRKTRAPKSNPRSRYDFDAYNSFHLVSQETGGFKVGPLPAGVYRIEVQGKGYMPLKLELEERQVFPNSILDLGTLRLVGR